MWSHDSRSEKPARMSSVVWISRVDYATFIAGTIQAMWDELATRYFSFRFKHSVSVQNIRIKVLENRLRSPGNIWSSVIGKSIVKFLLPSNLNPASVVIMKIRLKEKTLKWETCRELNGKHSFYAFFVCGHVVKARFSACSDNNRFHFT